MASVSHGTGNNNSGVWVLAGEYGIALKYWGAGLGAGLGAGAVVGVGVGIIASLIAGPAVGLIAGLVAGGIAAFIACSVANGVYAEKKTRDCRNAPGESDEIIKGMGVLVCIIGILFPIVGPLLYPMCK